MFEELVDIIRSHNRQIVKLNLTDFNYNHLTYLIKICRGLDVAVYKAVDHDDWTHMIGRFGYDDPKWMDRFLEVLLEAGDKDFDLNRAIIEWQLRGW